MNFMMAVKHAVIGYGIRRAEWKQVHGGPDLILTLDHTGEFYWCTAPVPENTNRPVQLLGPDMNHDLLSADIKAEDWEVI